MCTCKGCTRRELGCHANCEDYKQFCAERDLIREHRAKLYHLDGYQLEKKRDIKLKSRKK